MADGFFEQVADLTVAEIDQARKSAFPEVHAAKLAEVIDALSTHLGRAVAEAASGDAEQIERLLIGCEQNTATSAAQFSGFVQFMNEARRVARGGQR